MLNFDNFYCNYLNKDLPYKIIFYYNVRFIHYYTNTVYFIRLVNEILSSQKNEFFLSCKIVLFVIRYVCDPIIKVRMQLQVT